MKDLWKSKIVTPLMAMLKQGISHEKIALSIAVGITLGIFPVLGTTTALCAIAAFLLRLNLPAIQLVNFVVYPLQLFLLIPFLRVGGWLFGDRRFLQLGNDIINPVQNDIWGGLGMLWNLTVYAVFLWLIMSPVIIFILYKMLKPALKGLPIGKFSPDGNTAEIKTLQHEDIK
ncbi:MAG: DUF2062 domain-containing protein [Deltaproteobacteria bacterium]|nr:MAG: DUF2062 domain-containing protein [Deltaproteobacteria bacterium]